MTKSKRCPPLAGRQRRSRRRKLIERDGLVCWICALPINPDEPLNGEWRWSIDHVQPRSLGGRHELPNLKLAHRACNVQRDLGLKDAA